VPKSAVLGRASLASSRAFYFLVPAAVVLCCSSGAIVLSVRRGCGDPRNERRFTSLGRDPRPFKLVVFVIAAVRRPGRRAFAPFRGFASPEVMFWVFSGRD